MLGYNNSLLPLNFILSVKSKQNYDLLSCGFIYYILNKNHTKLAWSVTWPSRMGGTLVWWWWVCVFTHAQGNIKPELFCNSTRSFSPFACCCLFMQVFRAWAFNQSLNGLPRRERERRKKNGVGERKKQQLCSDLQFHLGYFLEHSGRPDKNHWFSLLAAQERPGALWDISVCN